MDSKNHGRNDGKEPEKKKKGIIAALKDGLKKLKPKASDKEPKDLHHAHNISTVVIPHREVALADLNSLVDPVFKQEIDKFGTITKSDLYKNKNLKSSSPSTSGSQTPNYLHSSLKDSPEKLNQTQTELSKLFVHEFIQLANDRRFKHANLQNHNLNYIPSEFSSLKLIKKVDLTGNNLERIPDPICRLPALQILNLSQNKIHYVPTTVGNIKTLKYLNLSFNCITMLPNEIGNLKALRKLVLDYNLITQLPQEIGSITLLRELYLDFNLLTELPPEITHLSHLRLLSLNNNCLSRLPPNLQNIKKLKSLFIRFNRIQRLDPLLHLLKYLIALTVEGNPLPVVLINSPNILAKKNFLRNGKTIQISKL